MATGIEGASIATLKRMTKVSLKMNDVNIKSENQSGGITAKNVSTGNSTQFNVGTASEKEGRIKTIFWWIFGLVGLLAAGLSVYKFLLS